MKAIEILKYSSNVNEFSDIITMNNNRVKPILKKNVKKRTKRDILVKINACSLAPGDCRVLSGKTKLGQAPPKNKDGNGPTGFPYVPGSDVCGTVVETAENSRFKVGDVITCRFEPVPFRGLGEYGLFKEYLCEHKPKSLDHIQSAALPSSVMAAWLAVKVNVKPGMRVLVLGGSGGVGAHLVQLLKPLGKASYVATTSTDEELIKSFGDLVDRYINYENEKFYEIEEFKKNKFDLIIDLASGLEYWNNSYKVCKSRWKGGRYVTLAYDTYEFYLNSYLQALGFARHILWKIFWTRFLTIKMPSWTWSIATLGPNKDSFKEMHDFIDEGKLKIIIDSVHPFTKEGVVDAFKIQKQRKNHGKVVVNICDLE